MAPAVARARIVRQRAKGPIDPLFGERVRALRLARGLTQAQLAGRDFSKGFISLVETGRTRVSLRAAEIFAGKLGVVVTDLMVSKATASSLEAELAIVTAELDLQAGRTSAALKRITSMERTAAGVLKARLQRLRGRVLARDGHSREAVHVLDEALRTFRALGERELVVRTLYDLAVAHLRVEERGEALNLALECERALDAGELVDRTLELEVCSLLASIFVTLGEYSSADLRTERARALAEDSADPRTLASLYEGLAVTREEQGDHEAALTYAQRALAAYVRLDDQAQVGSAWNTIGWVQTKRGQFGRAAEALGKAAAIARDTKDGRLGAYVLQTMAELELGRGHASEAMRLAEESIAHADASGRCRALSRLVKAEALVGTKAPLPKITAAFNEAFAALEPHGRQLLARAHREHFEVLAARGQFKEAAVVARRALELGRPLAADLP